MSSQNNQERPRYIENVDFMYITNPQDSDHSAVRLLQGPYEGVEYCYTAIKGMTEDNLRLSAVLSFRYQVYKDLDLITDESHFIQHIGDILTDIVTDINRSENPEDQMKFDDEEPRDDNPTEPITE